MLRLPVVNRSPALRALAFAIPVVGIGAPAPAHAADANVAYPVAELEQRLATTPFEILVAKKARDLREDVALKSDVRFADGVELRIKIRPANKGGSEFNNEPRYERAAFVLAKALFDEPDLVVPVTVLRPIPRGQLKPFAPRILATFNGADDVLAVVQYWLQSVEAPDDVWDPARFERDPAYAHHVANANVLTYLIEHGDSNKGNLLLSSTPNGRVFVIDSGVAFRSPASDRGVLWKAIRVPRLPQATVERLRALDAARIEALLGTVGQWAVHDDHLVAVAAEPRFDGYEGKRRRGEVNQLGLTQREVNDVIARRNALLERVARGELGTF
jgi:hypothetical protein